MVEEECDFFISESVATHQSKTQQEKCSVHGWKQIEIIIILNCCFYIALIYY